MNKQQKINSLTWKFFWKQKFKEVSLFILLSSLIIFVPYLFGSVIGDNQSDLCNGEETPTICQDDSPNRNNCTPLEIWLEGLFYSIMLIVIVYLLLIWFFSNWNKAEKKAKEELK